MDSCLAINDDHFRTNITHFRPKFNFFVVMVIGTSVGCAGGSNLQMEIIMEKPLGKRWKNHYHEIRYAKLSLPTNFFQITIGLPSKLMPSD